MVRLPTAFALLVCLWGVPLHAQEAQVDFDPSSIISTAIEDLEEIRSLIDETETTDRGGSWFGRSETDVQDDLNHYLDDLISSMVGNDYNEARIRMLDADQQIAEIDEQIDDLRVERLTAPASEKIKTRFDQMLMRDFAPSSREAIDQRLASLTADRERIISQRDDVERKFRNFLADQYGIQLTNDQVRAVLYQINGSSIIEASVAVSVLQQIEKRLGEIRSTVSSDTSLRRYYGVAAIMRLVSVRLHERHLIDYRDNWFPALDEFEMKNEALISQTRDRLGESQSDSKAESFRTNLNIQLRIAAVIDDYRQLLRVREQVVKDRLAMATADADLAVNTLRTLNHAIVVFEQFTWNEEEFDALMNIQNSDLIPLNEADLVDNFLEISRALAGS